MKKRPEFMEGVRAYEAGLTVHQNPYLDSLAEAARSWMNGWRYRRDRYYVKGKLPEPK